MTRTSADTGGEEPSRGSLRLLVDPVFGPFFFGKLLSTVGIWIHNIVAAIVAYELSGSAFVVGLVSMAQFGPQLVFSPLSGALADRGDRRRQLVAGRLIVAAGSATIAVPMALVGVEGLPGAWPVVVAALIVGVGFVVGGPAMNALIPSLVGPGELADAIALNSVPPTLARAAGPAIGALVATAASPAVAFALAAAGNAAFALMVVPLKIRPCSPAPGRDHRVRTGFRYLRHDPGIVRLLVGVTAVGVGADPVITLTPPLAAELGGGSALVGMFASSFGIGAGLAFFTLSPLRGRMGLARLATTGLILLAVGTVAAGVSPSAGAAIVSFMVGGAGMTMSLTALSTSLQQRIPDELRGRIMGLWAMAFLGSRPLAAAMDGAVADVWSPTAAFTSAALVVTLATWYSRPGSLASRPPPLISHREDVAPWE